MYVVTMLLCCIGAGAYAGYAYCTHVGTYANTLQKMVYPGNRRFLPLDDVQRTDRKNYPRQATDITLPPVIKTMEFIDKANKDYDEASGVETKTLVRRTVCLHSTTCFFA